MKIAVQVSKEEYIRWRQNEIEAIKKNGLALAKQRLEEADKSGWLKMNHIKEGTEIAELAWLEQLKWMQGQVKYIEKIIRKYEKEIREAQNR